MSMLYVVFVVGIVLWLALVFNALVGMRVVTFKGALHARVHRWVSFALILGGVVLGVLAVGTLVLGWFY